MIGMEKKGWIRDLEIVWLWWGKEKEAGFWYEWPGGLGAFHDTEEPWRMRSRFEG